ncbi:15806_t:CDS:1, partial [Entrophospora sp. SA101]
QSISDWIDVEELFGILKRIHPQQPSVPLRTKELFENLKIL